MVTVSQRIARVLVWISLFMSLPVQAADDQWQVINNKSGYYPGEPVWMRYSIVSEHRFAKLVLAQDTTLADNNVLHTHPVQAVQDSRSGKTYYRHRLDWLSAGRRRGQVTLATPRLEFIVGGRVQQKIASMPVNITRLDLPEYLPPSVLIGEVEFEYDHPHLQEQRRLGLLATERLYTLKLRLRSRHALPEHLPDPAALIDLPSGLSVVKTLQRRTIEFDEDDFRSEVNSTLYFTLKHSGHYLLDDQRLNRFDPDSGKMGYESFTMPRFFALPAWVIHLITGLLWLTIIVLAVILITVFILTGVLLIRYRRHWLALRASPDASTALSHLRHLGILLGWPQAIGVQQWQQRWRLQLGQPPTESLQRTLLQLQASYYGQSPWQGQQWHTGLAGFPHGRWIILLLERAVGRAWYYLRYRNQ